MRKCLAIRSWHRDLSDVAPHERQHELLLDEPQGSKRLPRFMTLKRATMAGLTALVTVNIWTGCPLLALWVGPQAMCKRALRGRPSSSSSFWPC